MIGLVQEHEVMQEGLSWLTAHQNLGALGCVHAGRVFCVLLTAKAMHSLP